MITEWLLGITHTVVVWFAGLFPDWTPPDFLEHVGDTINGILANLTGVGAWVDWAYMIPVVTVVVSVWGITFLVKIVRAVASYLPLIGGAG